MTTKTPVGTVLMYSGETGSLSVALSLVQQGWLVCDGSKYSMSEYAELYSVIGASYGATGTRFCVPSYKGLFLRGLDDGQERRDPDGKERCSPRPTLEHHGNDGELVGSVQGDTFQTHDHGYDQFGNPHKADHVSGHCSLKKATATATATGDTSGGTGHETRPRNTYVNFIIKFTDAVDAIPVGAVLPFSGDETLAESQIATGWLPCDGRMLGKSSFDDLQLAIESYYGATQDEFCLPDYRGRFLRGVQGQALPGLAPADPDSDGRTSPRPDLDKTGDLSGNNGNRVGSVQGDAFRTHHHSFGRNEDYQWTAGTLIGFHGAAEDEGLRTLTSGENGAEEESRPVNINCNFIVKTLTSEPPPNHCYQPGEGDCCFCAFGSLTGLSTTETRTTMMRIEKDCPLMQFVLVDPTDGTAISAQDMDFTLVRPDGTTISSWAEVSKGDVLVEENRVLVHAPQEGMWIISVRPKVRTPFWFFGMCLPTSTTHDPAAALRKLVSDVGNSPTGKLSMQVLLQIFGETGAQDGERGALESETTCIVCMFAVFGVVSLVVILTFPEDALVGSAAAVVRGLGVVATRAQVSLWLKGLKGLAVKTAAKELCKLMNAC